MNFINIGISSSTITALDPTRKILINPMDIFADNSSPYINQSSFCWFYSGRMHKSANWKRAPKPNIALRPWIVHHNEFIQWPRSGTRLFGRARIGFRCFYLQSCHTSTIYKDLFRGESISVGSSKPNWSHRFLNKSIVTYFEQLVHGTRAEGLIFKHTKQPPLLGLLEQEILFPAASGELIAGDGVAQ